MIIRINQRDVAIDSDPDAKYIHVLAQIFR